MEQDCGVLPTPDLAGVVLERHLGSVCSQHAIPIKKQRPCIGDLNDLLRDSGLWTFRSGASCSI